MTFGEYFQSVMSDLVTTHLWDDPYAAISPQYHDGRWIDMILNGYQQKQSAAITAAVINTNNGGFRMTAD
jgi:hypothetical protein